MGFIAGLIALPLGLIIGIIITVIYYLKKNKNEKELSTTKMVLSSLGVFFILIPIIDLKSNQYSNNNKNNFSNGISSIF